MGEVTIDQGCELGWFNSCGEITLAVLIAWLVGGAVLSASMDPRDTSAGAGVVECSSMGEDPSSIVLGCSLGHGGDSERSDFFGGETYDSAGTGTGEAGKCSFWSGDLLLGESAKLRKAASVSISRSCMSWNSSGPCLSMSKPSRLSKADMIRACSAFCCLRFSFSASRLETLSETSRRPHCVFISCAVRLSSSPCRVANLLLPSAGREACALRLEVGAGLPDAVDDTAGVAVEVHGRVELALEAAPLGTGDVGDSVVASEACGDKVLSVRSVLRRALVD